MKLLKCTIVIAGIVLAAANAYAAESFPTKPIRVVVPFPPGAASDFLARVVGTRLSEVYGQQIVIDNRPGAGGLIGSQIIGKSNPDGYTIGLVGQPHLTNVLLREKKPYDVFKDFSSISLVASIPNAVVLGNGVAASTMSELVALAKSKPGALNFGSAGVGSSSHLAAELFISATGIKAAHVPFKSLGDVFSEMLAGRVHFYVFPLSAAMPLLRDGRLRAVAVATPKRAYALPNVPTTAEAGWPQFQSDSWFGFIAPDGVPKKIIAGLNASVVKILGQPDVREQFLKGGSEPAFGPPEQFLKLQHSEYARIGKLIQDLGIKVQ
ncbi:MAG: tripartite tricarboxylate transporter substrate binding protein [Pseudomonadota bacterium]